MVKGSDLYVDVDVVDVGKENDNKAFGNSDLTLIRELDFHFFPTLYLVYVCVYIHVSGVSFKRVFFLQVHQVSSRSPSTGRHTFHTDKDGF